MQPTSANPAISTEHSAALFISGAGAGSSTHVCADRIELSIFNQIGKAKDIWQQLGLAGFGLPYQGFQWCQAYQNAFGASCDIQPVIVVGKIKDVPVVILPLGLKKNKGITTLSFLGREFSNQNSGLWRSDFYETVTQDMILDLLRTVCAHCRADCLHLNNVPEQWHGRRHPLALPTAQPSQNAIYRGELRSKFEDLLTQTHKSRARRNLARKERNLRAVGDFQVAKCVKPAEIDRALDAFLNQREIRAQAAGIPNAFSKPEAAAFLRQMLVARDTTNSGQSCPLDIWTLEIANQIRATYLCAEDRSTIYIYSNSIAHDDTFPNSPGLILAKDIIAYACETSDVSTLDFGLGQERYKEAWSSPEPLCDSSLSFTWKGRLQAEWQSGKTRIKSSIRNSERLWPMVRRLRQWKAKLR